MVDSSQIYFRAEDSLLSDTKPLRWWPTPIEAGKLVARRLRYARDVSVVLGCTESTLQMAVREFWDLRPFGDRIPSLRRTDAFKAAILFSICRIRAPQEVVETGVASGISSTGILSALHVNNRGKLHSIDLPGAIYRRDDGLSWKDVSSPVGPGWLVPIELRDRWELELGPSQTLLPCLYSRLDSVDVFYHDSEHTQANMSREFELTWDKLRAGGILVADNVNWNQSFQEFCAVKNVAACITFPYLGIAKKGPPLQPSRDTESPIQATTQYARSAA